MFEAGLRPAVNMEEEVDGVEKKRVTGNLGRTKKRRIAKIFHKGAQVFRPSYSCKSKQSLGGIA